MTTYAVIDTNVLVSSLITSNPESPTIGIITAIHKRAITPIYSDYLFSEYKEILNRSKFSIPENLKDDILSLFVGFGIRFEPTTTKVDMPDPDDAPIFLITMETRELDSYLVTGNIKHYPPMDYIVTPKRMMEILKETSPNKMEGQ